MSKPILCTTCAAWVDCGKKDGKPYGFCLCQDLFTYTAETKCADYVNGTAMTEKEFENAK